jgi:hypothetical protein
MIKKARVTAPRMVGMITSTLLEMSSNSSIRHTLVRLRAYAT